MPPHVSKDGKKYITSPAVTGRDPKKPSIPLLSPKERAERVNEKRHTRKDELSVLEKELIERSKSRRSTSSTIVPTDKLPHKSSTSAAIPPKPAKKSTRHKDVSPDVKISPKPSLEKKRVIPKYSTPPKSKKTAPPIPTTSIVQPYAETHEYDDRPNPRANSTSSQKGPSRFLYENSAEATQAQRNQALRFIKEKSKLGRDIAPLDTSTINWKRRLACKGSLRLFSENYLPNVFYKGWSKDQLICVERAEEVIVETGMFALAMPRGGGKTAICRSALLWATAYGFRRCMFLIGSTLQKAQQSLEFIKMYWYRSPELQQDFPELAWPIQKLENRFHLASGQTFGGLSTHVIWGSDMVRFPSILLPKEDTKAFLDNDPEAVQFMPADGLYLPKNAGAIICTAGIDGSIRGEADINPVTLEQPRPDLVLLDDVQKDSKADSPTTCEKMIRLIDGAVSGLSGPGQHISALMPCTVIREGDVADTYLDTMLKPDWNGQRCRLVITWPDGITDFEIRQDTPAGVHWNKYNGLRRKSLHLYRDISLATQYYREHREVMDAGFTVSWEERYTDKGKNTELSAQQHAMELRFKSPKTFPAEYQNIGRRLYEEGELTITADQLMTKTLGVKRGELLPDCEILTAFIDVQNEGFFWQVFGCNHEYTGIFSDWGLWPSIGANYYTKAELDSWSLLTNAFFKEYPEYRADATRTNKGHIRAPFEAKMYFGLEKVVEFIEGLTFIRTDTAKKKMRVQLIGIDTRYGQASDVIKRFIRESNKTNYIVPYMGQAFPPTNKQLEEYELRDGWLFEQKKHPNIKEPAWVVRPHAADGSFYMQTDVSRMKDRLFARLSSPKGTEGSIGLPTCESEELELMCNHICSSEYPEIVIVPNKGREKNVWKVREDGIWDNDYLDCAVGNMALASYQGASVKTTEETFRPVKRSFSEMYKSKRAS